MNLKILKKRLNKVNLINFLLRITQIKKIHNKLLPNQLKIKQKIKIRNKNNLAKRRL